MNNNANPSTVMLTRAFPRIHLSLAALPAGPTQRAGEARPKNNPGGSVMWEGGRQFFPHGISRQTEPGDGVWRRQNAPSPTTTVAEVGVGSDGGSHARRAGWGAKRFAGNSE
jgi:hypothetical protein